VGDERLENTRVGDENRGYKRWEMRRDRVLDGKGEGE
jgi:hypothetical protein